ncbi:DUF5625 family protein [Lysobacter enzymogenes]|uniref:DUF5625 domain-containing protein n=1 Tax=Lysobacter enzymogenes TaxID=69 RepID=A0A3N2RH90_LYSEN|nr:DUF5625 family protein [Lysobacter enzymogenes]ROU06754.1 hypothetical protein D9T17_12185 [Lysobacter enzymogenes]
MGSTTRTFSRGLRIALAVFALALAARIGFELWADDVQGEPLDDAPIAVASGGALDARIRLRVRDIYRMQLVFLIPPDGRERLRDLLAEPVPRRGQPVSEGVVVPLRWSLSEIDSGRIVAQGEPRTEGLDAWNSDAFWREAASFAAKPGWYRLRVQATRPVPELAGVTTLINVGLRPKVSSSWQTEWAWFGRLLCLLLDPLLLLAGLLLAWLIGRRLWLARRAIAAPA